LLEAVLLATLINSRKSDWLERNSDWAPSNALWPASMNLTNGQVQHAAWPDNGEQAVDVVKDILEHPVLGGRRRLQQQTQAILTT
jgi:hypothetical protein